VNTRSGGMGRLLRRYREARGLTQRELAAAAGMSLGSLRDLEQGRTRAPRWGTAEKLAAVLGLDPEQRAELARACSAVDAPVLVPERQALPERQSGGCGRGWRIEVLGPLAAWRDGAAVVLGSARQRAVLGVLALHAGTGLHRDAIIDALWGERPPASAVPEVQGYVSRLRRILGGSGLVVTIGGCCYRLNVATGGLRLDLAAFWQLTRQARADTRADPARACRRYEQALGLWRGDILADVDLLRGHPAAVEVIRERAEAVLGYAEAAVQARVPARTLPHLRGLCAGEPLNERAHAWLMTVLAATGQHAAALQVFTELRRRLDAELGILPSPVLAQAHARILGS
jgi:DNA-binding SARP family transcriptional activator/DNA-binding XRE family transcriptional regulator